MKDDDDPLWRAALAAEEPCAAEMASVEDSLRRLDATGPPLAPEAVARLVALATATPRDGAALAGASRRRLAAIAAAMLVLLSLAWVGRNLLWPAGTHALATLSYEAAVVVATQPNAVEDNTVNAFAIIQRECGPAFTAIRDLCADDVVPELRDRARELRDRLAALLRHGADSAPQSVGPGIATWTTIVEDATATVESRQQALAWLGNACVQGMRALQAPTGLSATAEQKRAAWRERLLRKLGQ